MDKMKKLVILILVGLILQSCGKQTSVKNLVKGIPQTSEGIESLDDNSAKNGSPTPTPTPTPTPGNKNLLKKNKSSCFWGAIAVPAILLITVISMRNCCMRDAAPSKPTNANNNDNQQEATK